MKAKIFTALLGKQLGLKAKGWEAASSPFGDPGTSCSVADIVDAGSAARVRQYKQAMKAANRATTAKAAMATAAKAATATAKGAKMARRPRPARSRAGQGGQGGHGEGRAGQGRRQRRGERPAGRPPALPVHPRPGPTSSASPPRACAAGSTWSSCATSTSRPAPSSSAGRALRRVCADLGVPLLLNDRPDLALDAGADGVHVGQDDAPPALARRILGPAAIVGLSTHSPADLEAALAEPVDYLSAGPVMPTPTKPGRPGTGRATPPRRRPGPPCPVFVTGGVSPATVPALAAAGVRHFVVVRWLTEADDPAAAARRCARPSTGRWSTAGRRRPPPAPSAGAPPSR